MITHTKIFSPVNGFSFYINGNGIIINGIEKSCGKLFCQCSFLHHVGNQLTLQNQHHSRRAVIVESCQVFWFDHAQQMLRLVHL